LPCLLLILYGAYLIISPFITAITWAVILAILVYDLVFRLCRHGRQYLKTSAD
jgi:predicted PurR-regulated permease PerM